MLISIALATYNGEKFIKDLLNSVLRQSLSNWELIICDDNSTDQTLNILEDFKKKESRIKVYKNKTTLGFKKNFEQAISLCNGDYIALCDQDDVWMPDHLELLQQEIKNYDCVCSNASIIDQDGNPLNLTMRDFIPVHIIPQNGDSFFFHELYGNIVQSATCMFSQKLVSCIIPFPQSATYHDWWIALIASNNSGCRYVDKVTIKYRRHESNTTTVPQMGIFKTVIYFLKNFTELKEKYTKHIAMLEVFEKTITSKDKLSKIQDAKKFYKALINRKHRLWAVFYYMKNYNIIQLSYRRNFVRFLYRILCLTMGIKW